MNINVRCDKLPQPFNLEIDPSSSVEALLDQICDQIKLERNFKDALLLKKGFPPRPMQVQKEVTLIDAGLGPQREKLIVSIDDEMVEKMKAEELANMDPEEAVRKMLEEEQKQMQGSNVGCDPSQATAMEKEMIKADGNCLFNCASLAMEGTVDKPDQMRR